MQNTSGSSGNYALLKGYLEQDPLNVQLLADTAVAALLAADAGGAAALIDQLFSAQTAGGGLIGEVGNAALSVGEYDIAKNIFRRLIEEGESAPVLTYNLAWAIGNGGDVEGALALMDEDIASILPEAAAFRVQLMHTLGQFDQAMEEARGYLELFPDSGVLQGTMAVLALDVEDEALALQLAERVPGRPEGLMTMGTLVLGEGRAADAVDFFDRSISLQRFNPRALIGRGLAHLSLGDTARAAGDLDAGADQFGDHIGSWIAAGWSHYVGGDLVSARARFERAFAIDPAFAETVGSLSVIDFMEGHVEEARRKSVAALRLDRECFSARLTQSLIEAGKGNEEAARAVLDQVFTMPVGKSGRTMVQFLAKLG